MRDPAMREVRADFQYGLEASALVSRIAAPVGVQRQIHEERLVGALRTRLARADVTIDADAAEHALVIDVKARRVAEALGVFQFATE
jgi:hypothetical protein